MPLGQAREVAAAVAVGVVERLDVEAVDDRVLPPQVAGGLDAHRSSGQHVLAERVDERVAGPGRRGGGRSSSKPSVGELLRATPTCCAEVGARRAPSPRTSSGRTCVAASSNCLGRLEVPAQRRRRRRSCATGRARSRSASSSVGAHDTCTCSDAACRRRRPRGTRRASAAAARRGALTVASPSAHSPPQRAVSSLTAAPSSGGGVGRQRPQPRAVDVDEPVVRDLLAGEQRAHHVDALAQPRVAHGLRRPAARR